MTDWVTVERKALKAALLAANTLAGSRVEAEQNYPVSTKPRDAQDELPKICVYAKQDVHQGNGNSTSWSTTATYVIDVWAYGVSTEELTAAEVAGDQRDELVSQVLGATTGSLAWLSRWESVSKATIKRNVSIQGELVLGPAQIEIVVELHTDHGLVLEGAALDNFEEAGITATNELDPLGAPLQTEVVLEQDPEDEEEEEAP